MRLEWLLVETLGPELVVVAQGHRLRKFVPLRSFLRNSPHAAEIGHAVTEAHRVGRGSITATANTDRLIFTEPVTMSDERVHGVQAWVGPRSVQPPTRPLIGAVVWDLTTGVATDTPAALLISGHDPETESTHGRAFAEDLALGDLQPEEGKVLAQAVTCEPGETYCATWDVTARDGEAIRVNFTARAALEPHPDGVPHLICRAMNWRSPRQPHPASELNLAQQILKGTSQEGVHRALVDLKNWTLLKWLDPPCPHFDWRGRESGRPLVHPDDRPKLRTMTQQFAGGPAEAVLRLRRPGGWAWIHVAVYRVHLGDDAYAGLISARLPTPAEFALASEKAAPVSSSANNGPSRP